MTRRLSAFLLQAALLTGVAALVWLTATGNWTARDWQTPAAYSVDALETLAQFRLAEERGLALLWDPTVPRLGAPGQADWSAYPLPDTPWYWFAGRLSGWVGLVPASNLMLLLAHVSAVLAFFACARVVGHRVLPAAGAALLFGFSFSILHRGLSHHSFALAFTVPPALLAVWLVAGSRGLIATPSGRWLAIGAGALTGLGNPYFIYLFGVLLGLAWLGQALTTRRRANLLAGAAAGAGCLLTFGLSNLPFIKATLTSSAAGLFSRSAAEAAIYGLRWIDLVMPPPNHRLPFAAELGREHVQVTPGEVSAPYLGLVGAGALVLVLIFTFRRIVRRRPRALRPSYAVWAVAIMAFAVVGGVNHWLAQAGFDYFRASNRYSIHLLAVGLFALSALASRGWRTLPRPAAVLAIITVTAIGLWDQIPMSPGTQHRQALRSLVESDRDFANRLEAALPAGAGVFQLPVAQFPEQGPIGRMSDYELLRPYLFTRQLHFSYGHLANSGLLTWQRNVAQLPPAEMVRELERIGFSALAVRTDAFADAASGLRQQLSAAGRTVLMEDRELVVFGLHAEGSMRAPAKDDPRRFEGWSGLPPPVDRPAVLLGEGWHQVERAEGRVWRWAQANATVLLTNPGDSVVRVRLAARLTSVAPATVKWRCGDSDGRITLPANTAQEVALNLTLAPGLNTLELRSDLPPRRAGPDDPRRISFQLADLRLESLETVPR